MSARYELIDAEKATLTAAGAVKYSIVKMCEWLDVSASGYYEWRGRPASVTAARRDRLAVLIEKAFTDSDGTYGHRRIHAQLARWGEHASPELVRALMRELGLVACQPRPWRQSLTVADAAPAPIPDLVRRDFTAPAPGQKMVGDITSWVSEFVERPAWVWVERLAGPTEISPTRGRSARVCPSSRWRVTTL